MYFTLRYVKEKWLVPFLAKAFTQDVKIETKYHRFALYADLYVACQSREGDLDNFFAHRNHAFPVSISEYGKLQKATSKFHFL